MPSFVILYSKNYSLTTTFSLFSGILKILGLLRLRLFLTVTVTVTVYGYRSDTAVYGYVLTLVNTVNTVHFCKVTVFTVFSVYFCLRLCTVIYGYERLPRLPRL